MSDSYCKPLKTETGAQISGGPAREKRIASEGGLDRMLNEREMRGYRHGFRDGRESVADQVRDLEVRVRRLERDKARS